jgi:hypothetical protein
LSLPLTPIRIAVVYECLRAFPPFCRLSLPPAHQVTFQVSRSKDRFGHYTRYTGTDKHFIVVSTRMHGHFDTLAQTVAHEMIHLHQGVAKTETSGVMHNAEFRRIAGRVCKQFGWDASPFIGTS